ncbi:MAG: pyridoxamine 5'-phosphate oxidase family protein [Chloroflexi bacterium]|nr:pyridoxamine 5'-phosphate oxidase family protein [Chloroflexota bacterium]
MEPTVAALLELCAECHAFTLATAGAADEPMAAAVYFAYTPQLEFFLLSTPDTQHGRNLARDPRAAVTLFPPSRAWQEIRGAQMRGTAQLVDGAQHERGWQVYRARFPFVGELQAALAGARLHLFRLSWARVVDNRKGFGHKEEWQWTSPPA